MVQVEVMASGVCEADVIGRGCKDVRLSHGRAFSVSKWMFENVYGPFNEFQFAVFSWVQRQLSYLGTG